MKITRKEGLRGIRIEHNKVLFWIIIALILVLFLVIYFRIRLGNNAGDGSECKIDNDCFAASCCHADSCVSEKNAPNCDNAFCTMECQAGTMDCGQGSCKCLKGKCQAAFK